MALTNRYISSSGSDTYANSTNSATPMSLATAVTNAAAGDVMNVKADGNYNQGSTNLTLSNNGSATSPIFWRGYKTTITDGFLGFNADGSLITTNMASLTGTSWRLVVNGTYNVFESLNVQAVNGSPAVSLNGAQDAIRFCRVSNTNTGSTSWGIDCGAGNTVAEFNDFFGSSTTSGAWGIRGNAAGARIIGNYVSGGYYGLSIELSPNFCAFNVCFNQTSHACRVSATGTPSTLLFNTLTKCGGDCINVVSANTTAVLIVGNMLTDSTGYGIEGGGAGTSIIAHHNGFGRNNLGTTHNADDWISATAIGNVTLTGTSGGDYQNYSSNDFRLVAASLGKGAGIRPYLDLGALQRQEQGGGLGRVIGSGIIG